MTPETEETEETEQPQGQSPAPATSQSDPAAADLYQGADAQREAFQAVAEDFNREGMNPASWNRIETIGTINNARHRNALTRLGFDPRAFRAEQYMVTFTFPDGHNEQHVVSVFTDGTNYFYPHISSSN